MLQAYKQQVLLKQKHLSETDHLRKCSYGCATSCCETATCRLSSHSATSAIFTPLQCAGGRYLNDVWLLNLDTLAWQLVTTTAKPLPPIGGGKFDEIEPAVSEPLLGSSGDNKPSSSAALPPSAGHILVAWGSSLLCIGGHTKAGTYSHLQKVFTS